MRSFRQPKIQQIQPIDNGTGHDYSGTKAERQYRSGELWSYSQLQEITVSMNSFFATAVPKTVFHAFVVVCPLCWLLSYNVNGFLVEVDITRRLLIQRHLRYEIDRQGFIALFVSIIIVCHCSVSEEFCGNASVCNDIKYHIIRIHDNSRQLYKVDRIAVMTYVPHNVAQIATNEDTIIILSSVEDSTCQPSVSEWEVSRCCELMQCMRERSDRGVVDAIRIDPNISMLQWSAVTSLD